MQFETLLTENVFEIFIFLYVWEQKLYLFIFYSCQEYFYYSNETDRINFVDTFIQRDTHKTRVENFVDNIYNCDIEDIASHK